MYYIVQKTEVAHPRTSAIGLTDTFERANHVSIQCKRLDIFCSQFYAN